jgi:peroxiredoxin
MKTGILNFVCFICLPLCSIAQQPKGFEITGHLEGLSDGEIVKLFNRFGDWHKPRWMDSCRVLHGEFHLKSTAPVEEGPKIFEIDFEEKPGREARGCALLIDNGDKIVLKSSDVNKMKESQIFRELYIEGSPASYAWHTLLPVCLDFERCYSILEHRLARINDSVGFDRVSVQSVIDAKALIEKGLEAAVMDVSVGRPAIPIVMIDIGEGALGKHYHPAFIFDLCKQLDEHTLQSAYGKIFQRNARLSVGQPFPNFGLPTPESKLISLKEFVAKNKITIVHFWASNSVDRQKYQRELKILYKKYHNKGLDIIGVSADSVAANWKEMIEDEAYPWANVSDLKGNMQGGIVNDVYNEGGHAIPNTTNVLVDSGGKIIAWDVDGVELQWYLWKYLDN